MMTLVDNSEQNRFELHIEGEVAFLDYRRKNGRLQLLHTDVPASLQGRGVGTQLIRRVLDDALASGVAVVPICPFVQSFLRDHPEYDSVVARPHRGLPNRDRTS